jgi:DNA-binding CsgD family transcriptional regulator
MSNVARIFIDHMRTVRGANLAGHALMDAGRFIARAGDKLEAVEPFGLGLASLLSSASNEGARTLLQAGSGEGLVIAAYQMGGMDGILVAARPVTTEPPLQASLLVDLYGLTSTEAEVAVLLAGGLDLEEIGDKRGVLVGTLRAQLRHIYRKMGVERQSQMTAAVWRLASV